MNAFGFVATRGQSRGVKKEDRDQAKVQVLAGLLRWTIVLILLVVQQKGKIFCIKAATTSLPPCKKEVKSREKTREFHWDDAAFNKSEG